MRPFPRELIGFSSEEGKIVFKEAMNEGTMECYFPLSE
jgi:glutathione gamma-glutamylcysteinyltransferase